ncbi:hypothetical protein EXIGLDRAFT_728178 [Exidia glandulosa HHB12029]|uniref:Uncharacterized protein n=1 Tax=Exidia glandulosa HHB12029 TaxID=1314781 RepID=A0A165D1F4_EXIGL|nr:hypothetical protein EXIGLDRAFT_728178 [Exidia glandulosa HHB12029]
MISAGPSKPSKRETVDERTFVSCTQTAEGRAAGRPPRCKTYSIRYMVDLAESVKEIPLPEEGNVDSLTYTGDAVQRGPATKYWTPGATYLWRSSNFTDTMRHLLEMSRTPEQLELSHAHRTAARRRWAAHRRAIELYKAGRAPQPPPWREPGIPQQLDPSTRMVDITVSPQRIHSALAELYNPVLRAAQTAAPGQMAGNFVESIRRGDPVQLWNLLGRVTNDYRRLREEEKRKAAADVTRKEKA